MKYSSKWKEWSSIIDLKTCVPCRTNNGKIYGIDAVVLPDPPLHTNCRCVIKKLRAISAGTATKDGTRGADWYLKKFKTLPSYYITSEEAIIRGWD